MIGDRQREDMRDFLVKAFSDGVLPEAALEDRLRELESISEPAELRTMVEAVRGLYPESEPAREEVTSSPALPAARDALPAAPPARDADLAPGAAMDPPVQVLRGQGMNTQRKGRWLTSERVRLELERSNVSLDFSELASFPGMYLEIEIDLKGSNVFMRFAKGTEIRNEVEGIGSNVHVTHKGDNLYRLNVLLYGTAEGSNLRAKTKALY